MTEKSIVWLGLAFVGLFFAVSNTAGSAPNILLIIGDDMGIETLPSYGIGTDPPKTAALDRLAANGVRFSNFWSQPICSPTRATMITGRYGFRTGIGWPVSNAGPLPQLPEVPAWASFEGPARGGGAAAADADVAPTPGLSLNEFTLPMAFDLDPDLDYVTAAIGKWHLADASNGWQHHPNRAGFDHYSGLIPGITQSYFAWNKVVNGQFQPGVGYAPEDKVNDAIEWIHAQADRRWFLWLAFNLPHTPLHVPPESAWQSDHSALDRTGIPVEQSDLYFKAMVEALDSQIGRLLGAIDPAVLENTYVIFLGDNGTLGRWISAPFRGDRAKSTVYQGGINVPLIVTGPGVSHGAVSEALVDSTDLFATILEMAGVEIDDVLPADVTIDSVSFFSALAAPSTPSKREWIYADVFRGGFEGVEGADYAIRNVRYKLLRHRGVEEFYDLIEDPYENRDLLRTGELSDREKREFTALRNRVRELRSSQ